MRAQSAEGSIQLEQLQGVAVQSPANQEPRETRRQEEEGADVSLITHKHTRVQQSEGGFLQKTVRVY